MGMFDEVNFHCTNCGEIIEAQSKAGDCSLSTYGIHDMPPAIAADLNGQSFICPKCDKVNTIRVQTLSYVE